ncbi:papilin-like isoform X2 [Drosophila willistoni]|uniref:papilin-like isoform X2 n=1 Tax=Drosophila willistoni TaxID=7260 RepID=UPI000C26C596|nr:papilin-like isoform X2 [Drosophila willistoni]
MNTHLTWIVYTIIVPSLSLARSNPVCHQKISRDPVNCNYRSVWSYNAIIDECFSWDYAGCDLQGNVFENYADCRYQCSRKASTVAWIKDHRCDLEMKIHSYHGACEGIKVWSYDKDKHKCVVRRSSGCAVSGNMFSQQVDCVQFCQSSELVKADLIKDVLEACRLPISKEIVRTRCDQGTEVFSYNSFRNRCDNWKYYGCEIRGNKFVSLKDCQMKCVIN